MHQRRQRLEPSMAKSMACGSAVWSYLHCAIVRIQQQFRQSNNLRSAIPSVGAVDEHRLVIFVDSVDDKQRRFQQTRDVLQPLSVLHTDQPPDTQASKMINVDTQTKIKPIKSTWDFSFIWLILTTPSNNNNEEQHKKPNDQTKTAHKLKQIKRQLGLEALWPGNRPLPDHASCQNS